MAGPTYSVHEPEGKLAAEELGVNTAFEPIASLSDRQAMQAGLRRYRRIRTALRRHDWGPGLARAFALYARALDTSDSEACLLKLWALLEFLTNAEQHEKVVNRASALWATEEPKKSVLQHLRSHRNAIVHESHESEFTHLLVSNLISVVDELFLFHLSQAPRFKTLNEACQILDLPREAAALRHEIRLRRRALRYRMRGSA